MGALFNPANIGSLARMLINVFLASYIKSADEQEKLAGAVVMMATVIWTIWDNRKKESPAAPQQKS